MLARKNSATHVGPSRNSCLSLVLKNIVLPDLIGPTTASNLERHQLLLHNILQAGEIGNTDPQRWETNEF